MGSSRKGLTAGVTRAAQRCPKHWPDFQKKGGLGGEAGAEDEKEWEDELKSNLKPSTWNLNSLTNPLPDEVVHSSLFLQVLGQICNHFGFRCPQNPNKYNSLSNLKRKQRNLSILACQRLIYHLSQALPNLLSQFHFFSRLKDELLQETIKQWTGSALKLVLSNSKEIANTLGQRAKYFQHFPRKINYFTSELQEVSTGSPRFWLILVVNPSLHLENPGWKSRRFEQIPLNFLAVPLIWNNKCI